MQCGFASVNISLSCGESPLKSLSPVLVPAKQFPESPPAKHQAVDVAQAHLRSAQPGQWTATDATWRGRAAVGGVKLEDLRTSAGLQQSLCHAVLHAVSSMESIREFICPLRLLVLRYLLIHLYKYGLYCFYVYTRLGSQVLDNISAHSYEQTSRGLEAFCFSHLPWNPSPSLLNGHLSQVLQ